MTEVCYRYCLAPTIFPRSSVPTNRTYPLPFSPSWSPRQIASRGGQSSASSHGRLRGTERAKATPASDGQVGGVAAGGKDKTALLEARKAAEAEGGEVDVMKAPEVSTVDIRIAMIGNVDR